MGNPALRTGALTEWVSAHHVGMTQLFEQHQYWLIERERGRALALLELFIEAMAQHIEIENHYLLPRAHDGRWPASLYLAEHDKILRLLEKQQRQLSAGQGPLSRAQVIALLDEQKSVKGVIEHHEAREEQALLPELEAHPEIEQILQQIQQQWGDALQRWQATVEQEQRALAEYDR